MHRNIRVLLVMEYWRAEEEKLGLSNENYHLMGSLSSVPWITVDRICPDSGTINRDGQEEATNEKPDINYIERWHTARPSDVIVCIETNGVRVEDVNHFRQRIETPIVMIWCDSSPNRIEKLRTEYSNIDLHLLFDIAHESLPGKFLWTPVPMDPVVAFDDHRERTIPVSYMGRVLDCDGKRWQHVQALRSAGIPVFHRGGQGEDIVPTTEYYDVFRKSKITLNFAAPGKMKSRVLEAITCGALLMEPEVSAGRKLFEPGKEIITFKNALDLIDKTKYYLAHDKERSNIAQNGYNRAIKEYNADKLWSRIFNTVLGDTHV